jgi:predicted Zn finger-like uncharacterized protein
VIVRCENCSTEFALDDAQVGPEGVTVRCSVCAYVFKVKPEAGSAADQPWQIQTTEDLLFTAPDIPTLRAWIEEGRLHPDDRVSRTGNHWLKLGEMPEFSSMFPGYKGLPKVFQAVDGEAKPKPDSERSAVDELGPPPAFAGEHDPPKLSASSSGLDDAPSDSGPASPLAAISKHAVKPITGNLDREAAAATKRSEESVSSPAEWERSPKQKGTNWPLFAVLGTVTALAIVFGVPQIRNAMFGGSDGAETDKPEETKEAIVDTPPELAKAEAAIASLGAADVARAEAAIQRAIDTGSVEGPTLATMKLAQADLLVSRALSYAIAAALDETSRAKLYERSEEDLERAARIFDGVGQAPDGERVSMVRARLRLAQGRDSVEILALLPETGADEMRLAVEASVLWRDTKAKLPSNLIGRLRGLENRSALGSSVLALALVRSGDVGGAEAIGAELLAMADDQPVGLALKQPSEAAGDETGGEEAAETGGDEPKPESGTTGETPKPTTSTGGGTGAGTGGGSGGGGGGGSFERLLDKGCKQVESGKASAGVQTLLKAFDRKPTDLDVLVCLGHGYKGMGNRQRALHFYERALAQSPRHRSALRAAAAIAAGTGDKNKALKYYKRLLQVDPMNAKAKVYVNEHGGGGGGGGQGGGGQGSGGQQGDGGATPDPPPGN